MIGPCTALAVCLLCVGASSDVDDRSAALDAPVPPPARPVRPHRTLSALLQTPVDLDSDSGPLTEALTFVVEQYDLPMVIDTASFRSEVGINDVETQTVRPRKFRRVPLRMVLDQLLRQVDGGFQEQDGIIVVVPREQLAFDRQLQRPISASFNNTPLSEAVKQISDSTGISVIVDARQPDKAATAIEAEFNGVPMECAVRILADMADLKPVVLDGALYLTQPANADRMQREWGIRKKEAKNTRHSPSSPVAAAISRQTPAAK